MVTMRLKCFLLISGDLKRICETELGLISQCCLTKHVFKISKQYLANVSLKINVKVNAFLPLNWKFSDWSCIMNLRSFYCCFQMGGRNTVLLDAISCRIPLVSDIPTIIFGADVTHPENGEESSPSIAAVKIIQQPWLLLWRSGTSKFIRLRFCLFFC